MASEFVVNEDLVKERKKCNFNIEELTYIIDGGRERTEERRNIESIAFRKEHMELVTKGHPDECLSLKERYENAIEKSALFAVLFKNHVATGDVDIEAIGSSFLRRTADAYLNEQSPFAVHLGMFVTTILGQGTPDQQAQWLFRAIDMQIVGTYAQTELGHGTFIRGLETTATYDPETEEFVLHTPTLSAHKWWPGGLGKTANHAIVIAQLYSKGECHGTHPFIVQIRDMDTHMPLPGVRVGEIGPRMGYINADNGFLGFEEFRIPRENMLMKNAQVLKDGTYVKKSHVQKMTYGTMVFIRVILVNDAAFNLAKAVTIAVRYSAVRRQCQPKPDAPEPQILDYITQQHKLFIGIATAHALQLTGAWLWSTFTAVLADMREGNIDNLPELHALSSCLKAISTSDSLVLIEQCRFACGGHGYMMSSRLPVLYSYVSGIRTNEGDYTILLLQCARFLVKAFEQMEAGNRVSPTVSYLSHKASVGCWDPSLEGIVSAFQRLAAGKISAAVTSIRRRMKSGMNYEDAWQLSTVQLVAAAEAHCRAVICSAYWSETQRLTASSSANVRGVMNQLASLYITYWALERTGDLLRYCSISEADIVSLQEQYEELLALIRPNAVGLVDAFDIRDEILQSTLGAYDGRVYERLMAEALKTPLNAEPVNKSFHTHLKPFMQGKL